MTAAPGTPAEDAADRLLPVAGVREIRAHLRGLLAGRWRLVGATTLVMVLDSVLGLAGPVAIGWVAQQLTEGLDVAHLVGPVVLLAVAVLGATLTGWLSEVLLARTVVPVVGTLREETVAVALDLPLDLVEAGGTGDLVSRVSGDVEVVSEAATGALGSFVGAALTIASTIVGLAALDWRFALAGLLAVPIQAHTLRWYLRVSQPVYAASRTADGRRTSAVLAVFAALPTLRALRLGGDGLGRVGAASADAVAYELRVIRMATRFYGRLNLAELIGLGSILLVAFVLVRDGLATVGAATTAALFFANLFNPINTVLGLFDEMQAAVAGLARLVGVVDLGATPGVGPGSAPDPGPASGGGGAGAGALEGSGLRFGYHDGPDVLHGVRVRVEPGRHVAVVGTTGSGKSSLASLLAGVRAPRDGRVTLDGRDLAELDVPQRLVALVTQETHVFAGSVADNVRLGRPEATVAQIAAAVDLVGATGWVSALPEGLDTPVGGGGHLLTAGQAQQLALARVELLDPLVVVLDEATAEAGSDAARALDRAAAAVVADRSCVVVAHRLSQAHDADLVLVMDHGRVVEEGTHADLLAAGGRYATLWEAWSRT